ncbi:MAG: vitamin B12-dependent ribonucleotide reductase [Candidatus Yanofskybacteria bacterium]|nr:vitamin B12-dependent ribonucleotide reductase [Candidatus Yanofskybacteria bacterium]
MDITPPPVRSARSRTSAREHTDDRPVAPSGFAWERRFGNGAHPYDEVQWERRDARITKMDGTVVFEQREIETPAFWSQTATDIVASKYFRGQLGTPERESSVRQMIDRVAKTIGFWGLKGGYFASADDAERYTEDLTWLLVNQYVSFNSPVWFNVGVYDKPQCSACFILSVDDTMQSILEWYRDEGIIFKGGSGSGVNISRLRSSKEPLSKGGFSSGPVSFMKGADGVANTIRSGGTTRRAAKMVVMNVDHPDLKDFIDSKRIIEEYSKALVASGISNSLDGDLFSPYTLLPYQNANNSVRVTDEFMRAVEADGMWEFKAVTTGKTIERVRAREVMQWIADAAWHSADPGMQYDTTINLWNTAANTGRINASNPCSEYMHLDNSACNLASLNLLKFLRSDGTFDTHLFRHAVDTIILGQEIIVGYSSYPTEKIGKNANDFRELGLGYANLGALLMAMGLPYDSERGRLLAGQITSLMSGQAYRMSARVADVKGPYAGYAVNKEPQLNVIDMHRAHADELYERAAQAQVGDRGLQAASRVVWHEALELAREYGVRNSQISVLAPTGTIAFMMDCATTGVEPELALVKYKKLVGGGVLKLVNTQVPSALANLGYTDDQISAISDYLIERETIEGAPFLKEEHLPVFDCSFKPANGSRCISHMGHLRMMGAAQPFISGAISKTINMPHDATVEDVYDAYMQGWKLGLKAIAIYRDGSKGVQPLNTKKEEVKGAAPTEASSPANLVEKLNGYTRIHLPDERPALTHKFSVGGYEGYMTVGLYPDTKKPGELFLIAAKEGSTISGLLDTIATLVSMCLQSGMPLKTLVRKFKDTSFAPAGFTNTPDVPVAKSITDYVFRYLGMRFLDREDREELFGPAHDSEHAAPQVEVVSFARPASIEGGAVDAVATPPAAVGAAMRPATLTATNADAPVCQCGTLMFKAGSCYSCPNCFATTGVCN